MVHIMEAIRSMRNRSRLQDDLIVVYKSTIEAMRQELEIKKERDPRRYSCEEGFREAND